MKEEVDGREGVLLEILGDQLLVVAKVEEDV